MRTPEEVARDHVAAVLDGDPIAMAADYAVDAVLNRPDRTIAGIGAIEEYFRTVPERLGSARVVFDDITARGEEVTFRWHLEGAETEISGRDVCVIRDDKIVHQIVHLDRADF